MSIVLLEWLLGEEAEVLAHRDFQLLMLVNVLPILGSLVVSPVMDSLIDPLNTTAGSIGLMISVFTAPAILIIPIAGALADRYGRKTVLIPSIILFGVAGTVIALAQNYSTVLLLRFIQGIGFAGISPIIITVIGDLYKNEREATGQGIRVSISGISGTVFPFVSGLLVVFAWQYPFLLYAVSFPIALAVYLWFEEPPAVSTNAATSDGGSNTYIRELAGIAKQRTVLPILIACGLPLTVGLGFVAYNSVIVVRVLGGSPALAGILAGVYSISFSIAGSQAGRLATLLGGKYIPLMVGFACLGIGFGGSVFAPSFFYLVLGIFVTGIGIGLSIALARSVLTNMAPSSYRAGVVSLAESVTRLLATLAPLAMGGIVTLGTPQLGFSISVQLAVVAIALVGGVGGMLCVHIALRTGEQYGSVV